MWCSWKAATRITYSSLVSMLKCNSNVTQVHHNFIIFKSIQLIHTTSVASLPTFHGIFEEQVIDIKDSCSVRLLGAQNTNSIDKVIDHFVYIVREQCYVTGPHDELPEHAPHLQPVFSLPGEHHTRDTSRTCWHCLM